MCLAVSAHGCAVCLFKNRDKFTLSFVHYNPLIQTQILQIYRSERSLQICIMPATELTWFSRNARFVTWGVTVTGEFHPKFFYFLSRPLVCSVQYIKSTEHRNKICTFY
jgi:hypothetical protein